MLVLMIISLMKPPEKIVFDEAWIIGQLNWEDISNSTGVNIEAVPAFTSSANILCKKDKIFFLISCTIGKIAGEECRHISNEDFGILLGNIKNCRRAEIVFYRVIYNPILGDHIYREINKILKIKFNSKGVVLDGKLYKQLSRESLLYEDCNNILNILYKEKYPLRCKN